ncbi:MAG: response regulator [Longimicrobiales bacterium]
MRSDARYSVLVVEDDPNHSLLISTAFAHGAPGVTVHLTERAEQAISHLLALKAASGPHPTALPDVIVLDVAMPGIGGIGFLQWLEQEQEWARDIPVIVFTSSSDPGLAQRCFSLGAREFKEKPADFTELVELVGSVLQRWEPRKRRGQGLSS